MTRCIDPISVLRRQTCDCGSIRFQESLRDRTRLRRADGCAIDASNRDDFTSRARQKHFVGFSDVTGVEESFDDLQTAFPSEVQYHTASYSFDDPSVMSGSENFVAAHHVDV